MWIFTAASITCVHSHRCKYYSRSIQTHDVCRDVYIQTQNPFLNFQFVTYSLSFFYIVHQCVQIWKSDYLLFLTRT